MGPTMFSGFLNTFRSLTASPITRALAEARHMARRRLEAGGAVARPAYSARTPPRFARPAPAAGDFVVPCDIDTRTFAAAIASGAAKPLANGPINLLVESAADGQFIIPERRIARIGGGSVGRGRDILNRLVTDLRTHPYA